MMMRGGVRIKGGVLGRMRRRGARIKGGVQGRMMRGELGISVVN